MKNFIATLLFLLVGVSLSAQTMYSKEMARSQGYHWTHGKNWDYVNGLVAKSLLDLCEQYGMNNTENSDFYAWAKAYTDNAINEDGSFKDFRKGNIDNINSGKVLFEIYHHEKDLDKKNGTHHADRYKAAADFLKNYLQTDYPRIQFGDAKGCFFHKAIYPNQMWLDGLYMGAPFYAEYAFRNNRPQDYADVINQFITCARHTYDPKNGLYRHACDVSRTERWADPVTGQSKHCWGRALGWYAMALVDVLDFIPKHEAGRDSLLAILDNVAVQVKKLQDPETGGWYQVMDRSGDKGNYLESSCSAMFIYSLFKAVRMGYIDPSYLDVAKAGYEGFLKNFIEVDKDGVVTITKACAVAGLGGKVYRSGDYDYYINETIRNNDPKAVGPFIMASLEYERLQK